jgi:hypothetical protein
VDLKRQECVGVWGSPYLSLLLDVSCDKFQALRAGRPRLDPPSRGTMTPTWAREAIIGGRSDRVIVNHEYGHRSGYGVLRF